MTDYRAHSAKKKDVYLFMGFTGGFIGLLSFLLYLGLS
jgi:hypothetical protein